MSNLPDDPLLGPEMYFRTIRVDGEELVWIRAIVEAQDGLGFVYSANGGAVHVVTTLDQKEALDGLLADLQGCSDFTLLPAQDPAL